MRNFHHTALLAAILSPVAWASGAAQAQSFSWQHVVRTYTPQDLPRERLPAAQRASLERLLVQSKTEWGGCEYEPDWPKHVELSRIPLGPGHYTLAEAGPGCSRSGQGANGAMWLVLWRGSSPVLLGDMAGWFHHVLPQTSHGLHDVTIGWHNTYREYSLDHLRFNGRHYRSVGSANVICPEDSDGPCQATPD